MKKCIAILLWILSWLFRIGIYVGLWFLPSTQEAHPTLAVKLLVVFTIGSIFLFAIVSLYNLIFYRLALWVRIHVEPERYKETDEDRRGLLLWYFDCHLRIWILHEFCVEHPPDWLLYPEIPDKYSYLYAKYWYKELPHNLWPAPKKN